MLKRQLPVYSPVSWRAVGAGVVAAARAQGVEPLRDRLAQQIRDRFGARDVLFTDSGTTALRLAIEGALDTSGGPVALPGYTCYDMASAAEGAGARVALYDLDPMTLAPEPESLRSVVEQGAEVVVLGHLFGHLVDVPSVERALGGTMVIEDAAQGVGGSIGDRPLGSFGSVAILSFGRGKGMTGGGGGALLAHDDRGVAVLDRAREHMPERAERGVKRLLALAAQLTLGRPALYGLPHALPFLHLGETVYHPPQAPRRASWASLAVLERVIPLSDNELHLRRKHALRLLGALPVSGQLRPPAPVPGTSPGYLRLPVVTKGAVAAELVEGLGGRIGLSRGYPTTLAELPSLMPRLVEVGRPLPGARELADRLVTLPTHGLLQEADFVALEDWIRRNQ